jgi:hypothetical protein
VSSAEPLDRKVLAAAFLRAQSLLASGQAVPPDEAQRIEETLRPLASAQEIRQVIVPLLDNAGLYGLAMAWDSGADSKSEEWLLTRASRFIQLTAPEFAFITLCELNRLNAPVDAAKQAALQALERERGLRIPMFEQNLAALDEVDAVMAADLRRAHRTTVALRPVGAGLAEFAGPGQPWVQLWAVTADTARTEAERLVQQCCSFDDGFIAGVGDCSLPDAAARFARPNKRVHVVDLQLARVRALLEIADLSAPLRDRRVRLHAGPRALQTLAPYASLALAREQSVVGGDPVAFSLLRSAAQA